ncbi:MAG: glutamate-5-semialdehyde dehydrogenase [Myxococcaceae bacterium]
MSASGALSDLLDRARVAARSAANASREQRDAALEAIAAALLASGKEILDANAQDLSAARAKGLSPAMLDRLALDEKRIAQMAAQVRDVIALPDPLAQTRDMGVRPNGIRISRRRIPLGVLAVVYEARPNVTVETAALALKSGNALVLRGGSEAQLSNRALAEVVRRGLAKAGLNPDAVQMVTDLSRERVAELLTASGKVDLAIPRGGAQLMAFVDEVARVPVLRHGAGICHLFLDASAKPEMAAELAFNSKVQRPGVCNAIETLLVHKDLLQRDTFVKTAQRLVEAGVELRVDPDAAKVLTASGLAHQAATPKDFDTEFLALVLAVRTVRSLDEALEHIAQHGTNHTASICTEDAAAADRFLREVDASCVLWNASTRFNDGGELGLGAEMGISTSKMHAFGPMGLVELTAEKFVVHGSGQTRR